MEHLKLEEILAFIDNSMSSESKKTVQSHISKCDECFSEYSIYKLSYDEISNEKLSVPSSDTIESIEHKLYPKTNSYRESFIESLSRNINDFLSNPIFAPVIGMAVIVFIFFFSTDEKEKLNSNQNIVVHSNSSFDEGENIDMIEADEVELVENNIDTTVQDLVVHDEELLAIIEENNMPPLENYMQEVLLEDSIPEIEDMDSYDLAHEESDKITMSLLSQNHMQHSKESLQLDSMSNHIDSLEVILYEAQIALSNQEERLSDIESRFNRESKYSAPRIQMYSSRSDNVKENKDNRIVIDNLIDSINVSKNRVFDLVKNIKIQKNNMKMLAKQLNEEFSSNIKISKQINKFFKPPFFQINQMEIADSMITKIINQLKIDLPKSYRFKEITYNFFEELNHIEREKFEIIYVFIGISKIGEISINGELIDVNKIYSSLMLEENKKDTSLQIFLLIDQEYSGDILQKISLEFNRVMPASIIYITK